MAFDHIHPRSKGGETSFENVCLACRSCNEFKSDITEAQDPLTGKIVSLFNPRTQKWDDHFCWSADSTRVEGKTAIGRVTYILHHHQKPGFLQIIQAETLNLSFRNPVSLTLLRMVQDIR